MNYLNIAQILAIHNEVIEQTGGSKGIRDIRLLESAIARPQATFAKKELYPDVFSKAAALGYSIISNHPFIDGNKRVGYMTMRLFLNLNGYDLTASMEERYQFVMDIANGIKDVEPMAKWLEEYSQRA